MQFVVKNFSGNLTRRRLKKSNIKKVMLVGFPMNRYREFYERGLFIHNQFILEYKILKPYIDLRKCKMIKA